MNKLEAVILDQHARVKAAGENPLEALSESQAEILEAATPTLTLELIRSLDKGRLYGGISSNAILRAQNNPRSILNRSQAAIRNSNGLAEINMIAPNQGYTGGILFDHNEAIVYGHSAKFNRISLDDPMQEAVGQTFYPPMMWAKALRAEAYKHRPESAYLLTVAEYMASLGLTLGCMVSDEGDIAGATGFMPGPRLQGGWDDQFIADHVSSEPVEAFRLSGLCDQAVLDPNILLDPTKFAKSILQSSGSLN